MLDDRAVRLKSITAEVSVEPVEVAVDRVERIEMLSGRRVPANNLDLRQSAAQVEGARQSMIVVGAKLRPQATALLSAATTRSTDKDVTQQNQSSTVLPGVAWEVDVWGRLRPARCLSKEL